MKSIKWENESWFNFLPYHPALSASILLCKHKKIKFHLFCPDSIFVTLVEIRVETNNWFINNSLIIEIAVNYFNNWEMQTDRARITSEVFVMDKIFSLEGRVCRIFVNISWISPIRGRRYETAECSLTLRVAKSYEWD